MAVQEQHDLADHLLLGPASLDAGGTLGPDAGHLLQPLGCLLDGVEHGLAERLDQLAGVDRADALDHAGAEIAQDTLERGRRGRFQEGSLELQPMLAVVDPDARGLDELAGADRGGGTDHGDQIALPADLDPQHAKAGLGAVEGHPLDQAGQSLALSCRSHAHPRRMPIERAFRIEILPLAPAPADVCSNTAAARREVALAMQRTDAPLICWIITAASRRRGATGGPSHAYGDNTGQIAGPAHRWRPRGGTRSSAQAAGASAGGTDHHQGPAPAARGAGDRSAA